MNQLISVIIPLFNAAPTIHPTLNSIINQTHKKIEIIFIDDASTDSGAKIIEKYKNKKHNIKLLTTNGEGFSFAKNLGLKHAKGKYIIFFKAGNLMSANLLEYLLQIIEENKTQIASCDYFDVDEADFYNYTLKPPTQKEEKLKIINSEKYLQKLGSKNMHTFQNSCTLWNKLIDKSILTNFTFNNEKHHSDKFATLDLLKNNFQITMSNQILIGNTLLDEHYKENCFNYNDLEEIEFLQQLIIYFKNIKNPTAIKNTCIKTLEKLYEIRLKLTNYFTEIYDLEEQKKNTDQKFSSIHKFLKSHYPENINQYSHILKKYKKLLEDEKFRKKFYYFYPQTPTKFTKKLFDDSPKKKEKFQ